MRSVMICRFKNAKKNIFKSLNKTTALSNVAAQQRLLAKMGDKLVKKGRGVNNSVLMTEI